MSTETSTGTGTGTSTSARSAGGGPDGDVVEPWVALGTELLVDEEYVKAWVERVGPGERRPAHTHRHPWITVVVSGAAGESRTPDGELIAVGSAATGDVRFNGPDRLPFSHYLANTSQDTLVMVAVELRDPAARAHLPVPAHPHAHVSDEHPEHPEQPHAQPPSAKD
ncbi:hypothetical protein [Streptomyces sp. HPF1205]|uniref:hypothetical protein n=1 Tax=Streptomyces sp. HPF1205 TaxID=2873262 RepID=UPI001CED6BA5|nr:hypothetical protein [Streptomyces sp. HPF1205]